MYKRHDVAQETMYYLNMFILHNSCLRQKILQNLK